MWVAGALAAVIALGAVIAFAISSPVVDELADESQRPERAPAGSACTSLLAALESFEEEDDAGAMSAIKEARREAMESLQTSNERFGRPEELALRLGADLPTPPLKPDERQDMVTQLRSIVDTCGELQG